MAYGLRPITLFTNFLASIPPLLIASAPMTARRHSSVTVSSPDSARSAGCEDYRGIISSLSKPGRIAPLTFIGFHRITS